MLSSSRAETLTRNSIVEPSEQSLGKLSLQHAERRNADEYIVIWIPASCEYSANI